MPLNPPPTTKQSTTATLGHAALRAGLLATVDLLKRCRAADIGEGYIDGYVALNWLEWNGGGLRLTETGRNVCRQLKDNSAVDQAVAPLAVAPLAVAPLAVAPLVVAAVVAAAAAAGGTSAAAITSATQVRPSTH